MLYLEDAYAYPRHPAIGRKHAYTLDEMRQVHELCQSQQQELIPVIPSLGHAGYITGKPGYADCDEGRGTGKVLGTLSPSFDQTYDLLRELYEDWCLHLPGKYLHVGLDESDSMGQYHLRTHGPGSLNAPAMFAGHCNRLNAIARSLGRRMVMWGDMFYYLPQAIEAVDKDIIVADWYYYAFDAVPAVELFGFRRLDSSRRLREAGLEVWGIPSIWPNCPFPDIGERWRNLRDWMRYGRKVGAAGIINAEWENSWGFPGTTGLMFRLLGRMCKGELPADPQAALAKMLPELSDDPGAAGLAGDIMKLGQYHFTAFRNRKSVGAKPEAMISTFSPRRGEYRHHAATLNKCLQGLGQALEQARDDAGRRALTAIHLSHQTLRLFWQAHDLLSAEYDRALRGQGGADQGSEMFVRLADELDAFVAEYERHWDEVRYSDDRRPLMDWAGRTAAALRQWAPQLDAPPDRHPLMATARLESILHCRHPALPVVNITIRWPDGTVQQETDILIRFESAYAVPTRQWAQSSVQVLDRDDPPPSVEFSTRHYGQFGVGPVSFLWRGQARRYRLVKTEGRHIRPSRDIIWVGPAHAMLGDPITRSDVDRACFELTT
jgi:hypothetical protein